LVGIGIAAFWGVSVIPDILIAWLSIYMLTLIMFYIQHPQFPFSNAKSASQGGTSFVKVMGLMLVSGIIGYGHYFISLKLGIYGMIFLIVLYSFGILLVNRIWVYKLITWEKIDSYNSY